MSFMEIGQSLWAVSQAMGGLGHVVNSHLADGILAGLAAPDPGPSEVDTDGILSFFASKIAPILLAVLGVIFIGRASLQSDTMRARYSARMWSFSSATGSVRIWNCTCGAANQRER